jgi:Nucleotidyl transferase AbiEii toxin, Type IV TA system
MQLFNTLNAAGARYVIVGGLASLLRGVGRTTTDVDIALDFAADSTDTAIAALTAGGYRPAVPVDPRQLSDPGKRSQWVNQRSMVVFSFWDSTNKQPTLDILLDPVVPFAELQRDANHLPLFGTTVPVASIAHLIALKLHSSRPQDLADIEHLRRIATPPPNSGSFEDARELAEWDFLRRTPEQRLQWLINILKIGYATGAFKPKPRSDDA